MSDEENTSHEDDYYPFRWKVADFVEDLFVLHRTAVVGVLALVGAGFVLLGFLILNGGSTTTETTAGRNDSTVVQDVASTTAETPTAEEGIEDGDADADADAATTTEPSTTAPTTSSSTTTTSTTTSTTSTSTTTTSTTTTTAAPESSRAPISDGQLASTEAGRVGVISPSQILLTGGLPTDDAADEVVSTAQELFPGFDIVDQQIVHEDFEDSGSFTLRLSGADLFGYNSDDLNSIYLPVVDQLSASLVANEAWSVEVSGHTDDVGPSDSNQRLSIRRAAAAAARIVAQGVPSSRVTSIGLGEDQPLTTNSTDAGRLQNRRVEFALTR